MGDDAIGGMHCRSSGAVCHAAYGDDTDADVSCSASRVAGLMPVGTRRLGSYGAPAWTLVSHAEATAVVPLVGGGRAEMILMHSGPYEARV